MNGSNCLIPCVKNDRSAPNSAGLASHHLAWLRSVLSSLVNLARVRLGSFARSPSSTRRVHHRSDRLSLLSPTQRNSERGACLVNACCRGLRALSDVPEPAGRACTPRRHVVQPWGWGIGWVFNHSARALMAGSIPRLTHQAASSPHRCTSR
jgi:hypothetical protein